MNKKTKTTVRRMFATLMITIWAIVAAVPAFAAPKVKKAEYEGKGRVEVDFNSKVKYKNVKVTVKDNKGATYSTTINEKDNDDLTFTIKNFKTGRTYTYTISGIKKSNESRQPPRSKRSTMIRATEKSNLNSRPEYSGRARKSPSPTAAKTMSPASKRKTATVSKSRSAN